MVSTSEVHLIGAVEYDNKLAEGTAHVLGGFGLAGTCGPSWRTAHAHTDGLRQSYVAAIRQGRDH